MGLGAGMMGLENVLRAPVRTAIIAVLLVLGTFMAAGTASAQGAPPPPVPLNVDERGVDVVTGKLVLGRVDVAIGPADHRGLVFGRQWVENGWRISDMATISGDTTNPVVYFGGRSIPFKTVSGSYVPLFQDGSTLSNDRTLFTASDGTEVTFTVTDYIYTYTVSNLGRATQVKFPDGTIRNYHFQFAYYVDEQIPQLPPECYVDPIVDPIIAQNCGLLWNAGYSITHYKHSRLSSITSSTGYQIKFTYANDTFTGQTLGSWSRMVKATALNNAVEYCDPAANSCSFSGNWPEASYSSTSNSYSVTAPGNLTTAYTYDTSSGRKLTGIKAPGDSSNTVTIGYNGSGKVSSVAAGGGTWSYAYPLTTRTTISNPASQTDQINYNDTGIHQGLVTSTNIGGVLTSFEYCGASESNCPPGLLKTTTLDEGNKVTYAYDARGNVTSTTRIVKSGGLANLVTSAAYPANCSNQKTCNKPTSTTDAGGNVTNYTWNAAHGGLTQIQAPAPSGSNPRPTTAITYATRQARYLTGPSTWSNGAATYVATRTETCRTAATCNNTANELETVITYPGSGTANNLLPTSVETRSGNGSLSSTASYTYDDLGRISTVDGPLAGANDKGAVFYDAAGRVRGEIGADPDGSGGNPRPAVRYSYNAKSQLTTTESGTATALTLNALNNMSVGAKAIATYDSNRRLKTEAQVAVSGNTQYQVVQYGYDNVGRPTCTALRMNAPLTSTNLPSNACTAMTAGSYGEDRITQRVYNNKGQLSKIRSGVGTALVQDTATFTYSNNGLLKTVTDANGNRTTYIYDGHDRSSRVNYPSATTPGQSDNSNYEQLTFYESGKSKGRVQTFRNRMGETTSFTYDNLGRNTKVTVPERSGLAATHTRDIFNSYNLAGDLLSARFDSTGGEGITFAYDAFGRPTSSTNTMFSTNRTIGYGYDVAGRRTSLTHPDSNAFTYQYDNLGRLTGIKLGSTQLASFGFDQLGRLTSDSRYDTAPGRSFSYDAAGRLASLSITGAGSSNAAWSFTYNPAGELVTQTRDNDLYAFTEAFDVNRSYTPNGLNQYSQVGSDPIAYDANGNLADDNYTDFAYDPANMLVSASGGNNATLRYDPLGRLFEVDDGTDVTQFLYDGSDLVGEYSDAGTLLGRYVHGAGAGDDPLIAYDGAGVANSALRQLYADRLGSIVLTSDHLGASLQPSTYGPWGIPGSSNAGIGAAGEGRFQYTGQAWLPELGLYHYKARAYSPVLGRFMQPDPIGYGDGLNMYAYVGNNPLNGLDPTGTQQYCSDDPLVPGTGSPCGVSDILVQADRICTGFVTCHFDVYGFFHGLPGPTFAQPPGYDGAGGGGGGGGDGGKSESRQLADRCLGRASALDGTPRYKATVVIDTVKAKFSQHQSSFNPESRVDQSYWASSFGLGDLELSILKSRAYGATQAANGAVRVTFDTGRRVGYDRGNSFAATNFISIYFSAPIGRDPETGLPIRSFLSARPGC